MKYKKIMKFIYQKILRNDVDIFNFSLPIGFKKGVMFTTERLVEIPFVFNNIDLDGKGKRILDFGCNQSFLVLQLASLGYETIGIDFLKYPLQYPNFKFIQKNIVELKENPFDYIIAVSVIEHIGLKSYHKENQNVDLNSVIDKLIELLKLEGKLIITFPIGIESTDDLLHCFSYDEVKEKIFFKFNVDKEIFYLRDGKTYWHQCSLNEIKKVSNHKSNRNRGGNSVACYVLSRKSL